MRSQWLLLPLLSGLLSSVGSVAAAQNGIVIRQTDAESSAAESSSSEADETSTPPPDETTSAPPPSSTTGGGGESSDDDVTVTVTRTVSGGGATATETRTVTTNVVTTILVTSTVIETSTVTNDDAQTATSTQWETTTVVVTGGAPAKRGFEIPVRTLPIQDVEANPTVDGEVPAVTNIKELYLEMARREPEPAAGLEKRDTVTETVTTTEGGDSDSTVTSTVTKTVESTTSSVTTTTEVETTTEAANAQTTVTVTSTRTETSTSINTDTSTNIPGDDTSNGDDGSSRDGLSTGAIAGIAVGATVGGLAVLGAIFFFCWRKRRNGNKYDPDDTIGGGSEVPVGFGGAGGGSMHGRSASMTQNTSSAGDMIGNSPMREPVLPKLASPEGYRGTATGRTGYIKPEPYGAAYLSASNTVSSPTNSKYSPTNRSSTLTGDHLPEHPLASDMDGGRGAHGAYAHQGPQAAELGNEGGTARWANPGAAEADSQPARPAREGPLYEMG